MSTATNGAQKNSQSAITARPVDNADKTLTADNNLVAAQNSVSSQFKLGHALEAPPADSHNEQDESEPDQLVTLTANEVKAMLDEINSALYSYNRALKFELHEKTDDLVVRVLNTKTDEIIRQYPSEEVLARKARLLEGDTHFFSTQVS
ncbi:flagellar protein FlaG [Marinospirillum alkaliphilum]|uniref:flagellar protein FlaG n=1 Tax=Marinospirillum alkaliphilum TaxID=148454 RepID=UPI0015A7033A|nr:flagellar protein FlaG [Marinospirillum alkaliphilum]